MKTNALNSLIETLPNVLGKTTKFMVKQELSPSLENSRFVQDTMTNLAPKAVFARSKADLAETSFLEICESLIVYYGPKILGENLFRKLYSKKLNPKLQKNLSKPLLELKNSKNLNYNELNTLRPIKAGISLSCLLIPLMEFSLSYAKNLFTLKLFKQTDFTNIANLNKNKTEDIKKQKLVEKSAKKNIKRATFGAIGAIVASILLVKKGKNSPLLQKFSELILTPGDKLCKKGSKAANFVNKYFSLDFADKNGKLALSKGQLTSCVLLGGLGYFGASKDRGKENFKETALRFPLVGFYVISGSELFEKGYKKLLQNNKNYKEIIGKNLSVPTFNELPTLAEKISKKNSSTVEAEFKKLCKQKIAITAVPFAFSILVMGLFVAGVSNACTRYRYYKNLKSQNGTPKVEMEDFIKNSKKLTP